jgi:hypothetical protein
MYLVQEIIVGVSTDKGHFEFTIPKGFVTDFRSGPDIARIALPKWGNDMQQTVLILLHDYNYSKGAKYVLKSEQKANMSKSMADDLLVDGLLYTEWSWLKCKAVSLALSIAGKSHYQTEPIKIFDERTQSIKALN